MGVFELFLLNFLGFYFLPVGILYFIDKIFHVKKKVMSIVKSYFLYFIFTSIFVFSVFLIIILILPEINWIISIRINSATMGSTIYLLHRDKTN